MKQIINKLVKQKTKINRRIGKIHYNIEIDEEEINKNKREIETSKRAFQNRKNKNKIYEDFSLRISQSKNSIFHYKNDIIVLKHRRTDSENLKNLILTKLKIINQHIRITK